jgi:hypothetical protein
MRREERKEMFTLVYREINGEVAEYTTDDPKAACRLIHIVAEEFGRADDVIELRRDEQPITSDELEALAFPPRIISADGWERVSEVKQVKRYG